MRAFAVTEECENNGAIVFAERDIEARKWGADEFNDGQLGGITCVRAPWADHLAGEPVPAKLMVENGWHFECCGCGDRIDEDWLDDNDLPLDGVIGFQHGRIFCSEICQARQNLEDAIKRDHERRAIEALKAYVLKRFPGVTFSNAREQWKPHAYAAERAGSWQVQQVVVSFEFPGMKIGAATCRIERCQQNEGFIGPIKPEYSCCSGDREVFEAWAASPDSRRKPEVVAA